MRAPAAADGPVVAPDAEVQVEQQQAIQADPALPPEEPIAGEPVVAEPVAAEPAGIVQAPVAPGAPVALAYPDVPSSAGLTPGAPLGSEATSDQKAVVGEELGQPAPGILVR